MSPWILAKGQRIRVESKGHARFWTVQGDQVLAGTSLLEVVAAMSEPRLSAGVLSAMADGRASIWLTPFEGVHRLTFGHELLVSADGPRVRRWFHPERAAKTTEPAELVMRRAIQTAIEAATKDESEYVFALSGGLDSTILLALAAQNPAVARGLQAYCAVPDQTRVHPVPGRVADEWPWASAVAQRAGVTAHRLQDDADSNWLDHADDFHRRNLSPLVVAANLWWLRQLEQQAVRRGTRVILGGQSGNATFSNGRPGAPRALHTDGTWERAPRRTRLRQTLRRGLSRVPPSVVLPGLSVTIPAHVTQMDPWTRWCLSEPPVSGCGPWSGANVVWRDPFGSTEVITAAMSVPETVWGVRGSERRLARRVGEGLIPDDVRLNQVRGIQGADLPGSMLRHAASYTDAMYRISSSPSARKFLDTDALGPSLRLLDDDLSSARVFQQRYLRPFAVGLFAAWWDEHRGDLVTGRSTRSAA